MTKNKTLTAWLAFVGGPLGLHRFYLKGWGDTLGWLLWLPTSLGIYGLRRIREFGLDDPWSWVLVPILGFTIAACALTAIYYGLMTPEKWNARFNPQLPADAAPGCSNWLTIFAIVGSLMIGTVCMMSSIVYSFQKYFEYQIEEARKISQ
jgi:TM2 domain